MGQTRSLEHIEDQFHWDKTLADDDSAEGLKRDIIRHIVSSLGSDYARAGAYAHMRGLSLAVRDRLIDSWVRTQRAFYGTGSKRVYYLSLEYLPGRSLLSNLHSLGLYDAAEQAVTELGFDLKEISELEWDAGLGNGGLGRLASCFMESLATLGIPAYGYGIRYDYGIFYQRIVNGQQKEKSDNWMRHGNLWTFERPEYLLEVRFGGRVHTYTDDEGRIRNEWVDTENVMAMPCDMLVPGHGNDRVMNIRLWAARASREFDLQEFNVGDYIGAVQEKVRTENISKVLYPSEEAEAGRELRLKQQYFFVCATLGDIMRRHRKSGLPFSELPETVTIHLNETHPAVAVPELMRLLLDEELLDWDEAWDIVTRTFAYTNHTILPEALETWPAGMFERTLPRHMQIIYEINQRFLDQVRSEHPDDACLISDLSLIQEQPERRVRMANLAILGSYSVNGVSALHSEIIKDRVFGAMYKIFPEKFNNKTNGVTPRLWLHQCNRGLARLIDENVGPSWITDLERLKGLAPLADNPGFQERWQAVKTQNKRRLADYAMHKLGISINPNSLFDVQVKRIHEYKRQILNVLHVIARYHRIKHHPSADILPRTVLFAGKAAPSYHAAKQTIHLINAVAAKVNADKDVAGRLTIGFLPNYCVSQAEKIVPAAELSEQISTAGMEASGTGNMKFALNGALTIGTLDGANIEIGEAVGFENMFIFGHTAEELEAMRKSCYNNRAALDGNPALTDALNALDNGTFAPVGTFANLKHALLEGGDHFFVLADFDAYMKSQDKVDALYRDHAEWTRRSILTTANMGFFSSDRSILEYARDIWGIEPGTV
jgi:starch phosphorylase